MLLGRVLPVVRALVAELAAHPACDRVSEAGSVRRRAETSRDVDLIATSSDPAALIEAFVTHERVAEVAAHGPTKATVVSYDGFRFDLRVVPPECYGNLLQHFTGSKDHNVALREDAVRQGFSVSEYGVETVESGEVFTATEEEAVYERLGYSWIPPELRENRGELEAARAATCPICSSSATCGATSTCTRPTRTAAPRSTRWWTRPRRTGTPTSRSATTRSGCATARSSARRRRSPP